MERAEVIKKIKKHGCRITKQRRVILDVILKEEASSCKEIYDMATKIDSGIGEATVYRMLHLLEELNIIRRQNAYELVIE